MKTGFKKYGPIAILGMLCILCAIPAIWHYSSLSASDMAVPIYALEFIWPIVLGVGGLVLSVRAVQTIDHDATSYYVLTGGVVGMGVVGILAVLLLVYIKNLGGSVPASLVIVGDMAASGLVIGAIVGILLAMHADREAALVNFKQAVEHAGHSIYMVDPDGKITYVNPLFEQQTGYSASEAIGKSPKILSSGHHDDDFFGEMWDTINQGDTWQSQMVNKAKSGDIIHVDQTVTPVMVEDGNHPKKFIAVNKDITARRRYERKLKETNEKLETLNSVLRHDVKNDVSIIKGWVDHLVDKVDEDNDIHETLVEVQAAVEHILEITESVRTYAESVVGDGDIETRSISVREPIASEVESRRRAFENAEIRVDGEIPDVHVAGSQLLTTIVRNLINNAIQHNDKETPEVDVRVIEHKDTVSVEIADNGPGISKGERRRLFKRGEKGDNSDGTGIGLHIVKETVKAYGGKIRLRDNEPTGTVFEIVLNKHDEQSESGE